MEEQHTERKLAAILAVNVAGYSRLISHDEEGTLPPETRSMVAEQLAREVVPRVTSRVDCLAELLYG